MILHPPVAGIQLADVITLSGGSVPDDLSGKWFIVEHRRPDGSLELSPPYLDPDCTQRYRPDKYWGVRSQIYAREKQSATATHGRRGARRHVPDGANGQAIDDASTAS